MAMLILKYRLPFLKARKRIVSSNSCHKKRCSRDNSDISTFAVIMAHPKISGLEKTEIHTLQVAAFTSSKQARELIDLLKKKGVRDVYQVRTKRKSGETWYKIRVGRFDSKENAQRFASQLIEQKTIKTYFLISLPIS